MELKIVNLNEVNLNEYDNVGESLTTAVVVRNAVTVVVLSGFDSLLASRDQPNSDFLTTNSAAN